MGGSDEYVGKEVLWEKTAKIGLSLNFGVKMGKGSLEIPRAVIAQQINGKWC